MLKKEKTTQTPGRHEEYCSAAAMTDIQYDYWPFVAHASIVATGHTVIMDIFYNENRVKNNKKKLN